MKPPNKNGDPVAEAAVLCVNRAKTITPDALGEAVKAPRRIVLSARFMPNPPNSRRVMRPSRYGTPHKCDGSPEGRDMAAARFEADLRAGRLPFTIEQLRDDLAGKNLICSCPDDGHGCHAEVLLRHANAGLAR
jgi:hypothetical protein